MGNQSATNQALRDARITDDQLGLFPTEASALCKKLGINWMALVDLWEKDLLSFEPKSGEQLLPSQEAEVEFLGALVCSGCDHHMLTQLLEGLAKPYAYNTRAVYFDWSCQEWKYLPQDPDLEELVYDYIEQLTSDDDRDSLEELADRIQSAISNLGDS